MLPGTRRDGWQAKRIGVIIQGILDRVRPSQVGSESDGRTLRYGVSVLPSSAALVAGGLFRRGGLELKGPAMPLARRTAGKLV